eukprot:TRINITY_DN3825_c0_g1_i3.p1 TRINITY_DN3825_c0_g1~~TRINITY_DN3825_c0_g1_i3.p1  ORF type:complete len:293 (-),score=39.56 TRINITY_DN3825_c0_g1_i3:48-926(-)
MGHSHSHHASQHGRPATTMSYGQPAPAAQTHAGPPAFQAIRDKYESLEQVQDALRKAGLESSNLIIGVDYTKSNDSAGKRTFGGHSLHALLPGHPNPYMQAISIVGRTMEVFDDDKIIPAFGFGDKTTEDKRVFPFCPDRPCNGVQDVLDRYSVITPQISLAGPTSFAPIIRQALQIIGSTRQYHILIIIADGQVTPDNEWTRATSETIQAIVEASNYPLSIVMIGVGDGPWDMMEHFDDQLPQRRFDNFQFVEFHKVISTSRPGLQEVDFALSALQEIPDQFLLIRKLGLI